MKALRKAGFILFFPVALFTISGFYYGSDTYFEIKRNFTIFSEVFEEVSRRYVIEVDAGAMMRTAVNAMLETLDPYTALIDESGNREIDIVTSGQYAGVGLEVGARGGRLVVIAPIEGYSAHRRGVRAGDVIISVNGISARDFTPEDLQTQLRGEAGTTVKITVQRYGIEENLEFELVRETIEVKNVIWAGLLEADQRIGYVMLQRFGQNAAQEVADAIVSLEAEQKLDALVLDLRNNPGGLLDEAVKLADLFLEPGIDVVKTKGRLPETNFSYQTRMPPLYTGRPLFVLQNSGSASASEIVSGALQDLDKAVIIGERSFGKGLVQIVRPLSYNMAVKITTSKYYTPSGRSLQAMQYLGEEETAGIDVPDSLRQVFQTRAGRKVFEGLGIEPDIAIEEHNLNLLEIALLRNSHYFFFANQFTSQFEEFPENISSADIFDRFMAYLHAENFTFETRSQRAFTHFLATLDSDIVSTSTEKIQAVEELIALDKQQMMEESRTYIKRDVMLELISRYEGSSGRLRKSLIDDPMILRVKELTAQPDHYFAILK